MLRKLLILGSFVLAIHGVQAKNLLREDIYLRPGFDQKWIKVWPEQTRETAAWKHVPATSADNRPVKIATLGTPFPTPGIYYWPENKVHEYTAVTRFFLTPEEKKAQQSWGVRLGSIADNWQIFLNGNLIGGA